VDSYRYGSEFFDFVDWSSGRSAKEFLARFQTGLSPRSVLDVGCGRGVWLAAWRDLGVNELLGVDGEYVDRASLRIPEAHFVAKDIAEPFRLGKRFELVQCLEVAEHIPERYADNLLDNLVGHGDVVLFSAAQPGQGGEHHVNEQPLSYWIRKFRSRGLRAFDFPRHVVDGVTDIEPWYRYNTLLFATDAAASSLASNVAQHELPETASPKEFRPFLWRARCMCIRLLPPSAVQRLARLKHRAFNAAK
jgi:SAM-dependent methyltransferase